MTIFAQRQKLSSSLLFMSFLLSLLSCSLQSDVSEKTFTGKWNTTRSSFPIYLHANGEWEIKTSDGVILQYGIWEYRKGSIIWSYKVDSYVAHDENPVLFTSEREFKVKEKDGTTTTFSRVDSP